MLDKSFEFRGVVTFTDDEVRKAARVILEAARTKVVEQRGTGQIKSAGPLTKGRVLEMAREMLEKHIELLD